MSAMDPSQLYVDPDLEFADIFQLLNSPPSMEECFTQSIDFNWDRISDEGNPRHRSSSLATTDSSSPKSSTSSPKSNIESRRAASRLGARRRRGSETKLLQDLARVIAPPSAIDKMSTLRLAVSQLKLKRVLSYLNVENTTPSPPFHPEHVLGGGFLLVVSGQGQLLYISSTVQTSLGFSSFELIGRSLYEHTHPSDHADIHGLLTGTEAGRVSGLLRLRCSTKATRDPSHMRADPYKVFQVGGRLYNCEEPFFIGLADPIPHPADNRFPVWHWLNQQVFTTVHSLDMKFLCADASMSRLLGYAPEDYIGHTCYDFIHPSDLLESTTHIRTLYEKGQAQTDQFRILKKGGGHIWVYTQKTSLNSNAVISRKNRTIVVCRHFTIGVEEGGELQSAVQVRGQPRAVYYPTPPSSEGGVGDGEGLGGELKEGLGEELGSLAAEIDLEALPAFTEALDAFLSSGAELLEEDSTPQILGSGVELLEEDSTPQILGKRSHAGPSQCEPMGLTARQFPTLTGLLKGSGSQTLLSKKYKSTTRMK